MLAAACRYATVTQWIYNNIHNNPGLPYCATANSGGEGALAYALSQYASDTVLSLAEVAIGPPTGRLLGADNLPALTSCGTVPNIPHETA